jgi:hypothetical protein
MARRKSDPFDFQPGRILAGRYRVQGYLGGGWEGEVYRVDELRTGISRAAKVFYPERNPGDRALRHYAKKLHKLRHCDIVMQYHHSETFWNRGQRVTCLISELVEGQILSALASRRPGRRLPPFEALHLLHALASGLEPIHALREYHGDLHDKNVLVARSGVHFRVRLLDFYPWGRPDRAKIRDDVIQLVRIFYDLVGGRSRYAAQPPEVKAICCGLRRDLIGRRFPTAGALRAYLDNFDWT